MPTYRYEAFDKGAQTKRGTIVAGSEMEAGTMLREEGLFVQFIEPNSAEPMKTILPGSSDGDHMVSGHVETATISYEKKEKPVASRIVGKLVEKRVSEKKLRHSKAKPVVEAGENLSVELELIAAFYVQAQKTASKSFRGILAADVMKAELKTVVCGLVQDAFKRGFEDYLTITENQM